MRPYQGVFRWGGWAVGWEGTASEMGWTADGTVGGGSFFGRFCAGWGTTRLCPHLRHLLDRPAQSTGADSEKPQAGQANRSDIANLARRRRWTGFSANDTVHLPRRLVRR